MKDYTKDLDYVRLVQEEIEHYAEIEITEDLKEGGAHANSAWHHYWGHVAKALESTEFLRLDNYLARVASSMSRPVEVLSLGSGYCGNELALARSIKRNYQIRCIDINERLFERAKVVVRDEGLSMEFGTADLNFITIEPGRYDLIYAHAAIHHVINLEHLFEQVVNGLSPSGIFHLVDVVGQNRKLIWDENERYANALLDLLPARLTRGIRLAVPAEADGMEGIRQAEINFFLDRFFNPLFEHRHGAFMRFICTHPDLGTALDPADQEARRYLDFLVASDECSVRHAVLRPLEVWGVYRPASASTRVQPRFSPGGGRD